MRKTPGYRWASLLLAFLLGSCVGVLWSTLRDRPRDISVYPVRTFEDGRPVAIGMAVYRVDLRRQDVLWWRPGLADAPDRLSNCAIRDLKNWRCETSVAGEASVVMMQRGEFEETVLSMRMKDRGVSRDEWEKLRGNATVKK